MPIEPSLSALRSKRREIMQIAHKYGVKNIRVFGSVVRGDGDDDSDIDILLDGDYSCGYWDILKMTEELEDFLGRRVDVITDPENIRYPEMKQHILQEAVPL